MTKNQPLAAQVLPQVDPAARTVWRNDGEWRIWMGWAAAAILHGGLLAALIFSWPAHLNPAPPNPSSISLLIVAADKPGNSPAVRPKPPEVPAIMAATMPSKIASSQPAKNQRSAVSSPGASSRLHRVSLAASAPRGVTEAKPVAQQDGDGFVAAEPVGGAVNQAPEYPEEAQLHGEQGDVLLSIHVLANGQPDEVSVTQSSGYDILDQAAAKAVWKWRFQPSTLVGHPVTSVIPYRIHFNLQNTQPAD